MSTSLVFTFDFHIQDDNSFLVFIHGSDVNSPLLYVYLTCVVVLPYVTVS